jgi:hypothetical protein
MKCLSSPSLLYSRRGRADLAPHSFSSALNERLSLLFLDLRSSTRIVSLKAFASSFTLSAHNRHSPLAIINQGGELRYPRKSVSWKEEGGSYFIGRVDRDLLKAFGELLFLLSRLGDASG